MSKESIGSRSESRPEWEHLEDWVQGQVQRLIQDLLEQEVTEFLGRARSVRRADSDSDTGYRNGYAPPRKLTLSSGTIHLRRPRVRHTEERFESRLLTRITTERSDRLVAPDAAGSSELWPADTSAAAPGPVGVTSTPPGSPAVSVGALPGSGDVAGPDDS